MVIIAIRDRVASRFLNIGLERNDAVACRDFVNSIRVCERDSLLMTNPEDFDLVRIGKFDSSTGMVENDFAVLMTGVQALASSEVDDDAS